MWLGHYRRIQPPGLFALYVTGYSVFRIFEESLRVDPSEHLLGLRLNMHVAPALACFAVSVAVDQPPPLAGTSVQHRQLSAAVSGH